MKVCVIGSSPNVLERETGEFVDSCDRIIRMNNFRIEGYEKHVGSRIDIVSYAFTGLNPDYSQTKNAKEIWSSRPWEPKRRRTASKLIGSLDNIKVPSQAIWRRLVEVLRQAGFWRLQPSSGIVTIDMAMETFPQAEIYILGFDDEKWKRHYFDKDFLDDDSMGPVGHDWETESEVIRSYLKDGRVRLIP